MVSGFFQQNKTKQSSVSEDCAKFVGALPVQIKKDVNYLASIPVNTDNLLTFLGDINLLRLQVVFSRITVQAAVTALSNANLLSNLEKFLHTHINILRLNALNGLFNALSVGIYGTRFLINIFRVIKNAIKEIQKNDPWYQFFINFGNEIYKIHPVLLNDITWGVVNGMTNFAILFGITAPIASSLIAVFLCFDIWLLTHRLWLAKKEYEKEKLIYQNELERLMYIILETNDLDEKNEKFEEYLAINAVLNQKTLEWEAKSACFWFNTAGATLLGVGFVLSLILSFPASAPLAFLICTLGIAMYATGDIYQKYKLASLYYKENKNEQTRCEMIKARNEFIFSYAKNVIMPLLILTTFALNWPAGIVLVVTYLIYEYIIKTWNNKEQLTGDKSMFIESINDESEAGDDLENEKLPLLSCEISLEDAKSDSQSSQGVNETARSKNSMFKETFDDENCQKLQNPCSYDKGIAQYESVACGKII